MVVFAEVVASAAVALALALGAETARWWGPSPIAVIGGGGTSGATEEWY